MIEPYDAETLQMHLANVAQKQDDLNTATRGRDEQIRGMLRKGAGPTALAALVGVSRARIYQIRDSRR